MRRSNIILALTLLATPAVAAAPVSGNWFTDGKDSIVRIGQCGATLCGKVVKIIKPGPAGFDARDANNPDPKLRGRPILGMTILSDFKDTGKVWEGRIYDPRAGKTYRSTMEKTAKGTLNVKGCVGPFCRTVVFTPT